MWSKACYFRTHSLQLLCVTPSVFRLSVSVTSCARFLPLTQRSRSSCFKTSVPENSYWWIWQYLAVLCFVVQSLSNPATRAGRFNINININIYININSTTSNLLPNHNEKEVPLTFDIRVVYVRLQVFDEFLQLFPAQRRSGRTLLLLQQLQVQVDLWDGRPPVVERVKELLLVLWSGRRRGIILCWCRWILVGSRRSLRLFRKALRIVCRQDLRRLLTSALLRHILLLTARGIVGNSRRLCCGRAAGGICVCAERHTDETWASEGSSSALFISQSSHLCVCAPLQLPSSLKYWPTLLLGLANVEMNWPNDWNAAWRTCRPQHTLINTEWTTQKRLNGLGVPSGRDRWSDWWTEMKVSSAALLETWPRTPSWSTRRRPSARPTHYLSRAGRNAAAGQERERGRTGRRLRRQEMSNNYTKQITELITSTFM